MSRSDKRDMALSVMVVVGAGSFGAWQHSTLAGVFMTVVMLFAIAFLDRES